MDLLQWAPVVFSSTSSREKARLLLEIRAWLRCLFCGQVTEVVAAPCLLNHVKYGGHKGDVIVPVGQTGTYLDKPESRYHQAAGQISSHRACNHCGFVSKMPDVQVGRMKKDMARVMDEAWIVGQTAAIGPTPATLSRKISSEVMSEVRNLGEQELASVRLSMEKRVDVKVAELLNAKLEQIVQQAVSAAVARLRL